MVPQRISLITIGARDLPSLRAFYKRLGWAETEISSDTYTVFKTAGVLLSLFPIDELARDAGVEIVEHHGFNGITLAINVDTPEQVDEVIASVKQAGGQIIREPSDAFWGGRTSYFSDPEGYFWEVAWNPTALFDERGAMLSF